MAESTENSGPEFLKVTEVAERLNLGKSTIYELVYGGELEHVRFGRAIRVLATSVETWLEARRAASPAATR